MGLTTLKKRAEFLRLRGGGRCATDAFVLEGRRRVVGQDRLRRSVEPSPVEIPPVETPPVVAQPADVARFGFTITRKIGNAVVRNRIRRRLKAAVGEIAPGSARQDCDYVLVARRSAVDRDFAQLKADLAIAFARVNAAVESGKSRRK